MKLAIVGVTGVVGREILEVLLERAFPFTEIIPVASKKSCGNIIRVNKKTHTIISLEDLLEKKPDLALFSAGSKVSKEWAPKLANNGCRVIDNSSYWRLSSKHKLIIPEINGKVLSNKDMIISNPNCSTIQLLMALTPLHKKYTIKRVVVSTYQAVSGTGKKAIEQLKNEEKRIKKDRAYPFEIYQNVLPQCDDFTENNYTKEEMKLTNETKKILDKNIRVSATAVRVPVIRGHSESVNINFENDFCLDGVKEALKNMHGVSVLDDPEKQKYPTPLNSYKKD